LRAGDLVWRVDPAELDDDAHDGPGGTLCEDGWYSSIACESVYPPVILVDGVYTFPPGQPLHEDRQVYFDFNIGELPLQIQFPYEITVPPDLGTDMYFWYAEQPFNGSPNFTGPLDPSGTIQIDRTPGAPAFSWGFSTVPGNPQTMDSGEVQVTCDSVASSTPFQGYIAWPYLDFGMLGRDKQMEGFDLVITGECSVSIGYTQTNFALATTPYTINGDTLVGGMIPMPLTGPSFQFRLTFTESQQWEWFASNMYCNDLGPG
jgi:hypothetical protein